MKNKFIENPWRIFNVLAAKGILTLLPDKPYLKLRYRATFDKKLNLKNPQTFNEKLQWLKLYDRKMEYTQMVDKYEVKKYVSQIIGPEYIIPTFGVWNSFDEIDFNILPERFVLKCTHDSGGLVICKDKSQLNIVEARKKIEKSLKNNYYKWGREWVYKNVRPRIIAEKYMQDDSGSEIMDYKIHCFNGKPEIILVCSDRYSDSGLREDFFDVEWKHLDIARPGHPFSEKEIPAPASLHLMIDLAQKLSARIPFVRIDFYEVKGKIYFGEITFFPSSGFAPFEPKMIDNKLGYMIKIKGINEIC